MLLARREKSLRGLGDASLPADLQGSLVVGSPSVAPLPEDQHALVEPTLAEVKQVSSDIASMEAALAAPPETPAQATLLTQRLAALQDVAERVRSLASAPVQRAADLAALKETARQKQVEADALKASLSGLGGETLYPSAIPYVDVSNPATPRWNVVGNPGAAADIAAGRQGVQFMEEPGWVLASKDNQPGNVFDQPHLRPVFSQLMACPTSETWAPGKRKVSNVRQRLVADGLVTECESRFVSPVPAHYDANNRVVGPNGQPVTPGSYPEVSSTCGAGPRYAPQLVIDQDTLSIVRKGSSASPFSYTGVRYLQANASTDFNTQRWLEAGAPDELWVCVHDVETGWPHLMSEIGNGIKAALQNPYVAGAIAAVFVPAPLIIREFANGHGDDMARTLARVLSSGMIVPGFGPVLAVVAPKDTQRFLETATSELFFTVPGFSSLVIYSELNKQKRDALRIKLTKKQAEFYAKYKIGIVIQVVTAAIAIAATIITAGAAAPAAALALTILNTAISVTDALYQAEIAMNSLTIMEKSLKAQNAAELAAYDQAYRDLAALIAGLDQQIADLRSKGAKTIQSAPAGLPTPGVFGFAAAILLGLFVMGRK